jgi:hypothetical protein
MDGFFEIATTLGILHQLSGDLTLCTISLPDYYAKEIESGKISLPRKTGSYDAK